MQLSKEDQVLGILKIQMVNQEIFKKILKFMKEMD